MISSGSSTLRLDRPPVEQDRRLEDHPVVAVEARLVRRLAVDDDRPVRRRRQVADDPQQRRLAAARRPMSDTNSPARSTGRCRRRASTRPAAWPRGANTFETPAISTTGLAAIGLGHRAAAPLGPALVAHDEGLDAGDDEQVHADPQDRRHDDRRPQVLGVEGVVLHAGDDLARQAVLDERGQLADDRADDRRRRRDPEAGEQVRARRRQPQLAQDRPREAA